MATPSPPILVGSGVLIVTIGGIAGFVLAVRTQLSVRILVLIIGGGTALAAVGVLVSLTVRRVAVLLAYGILIGFPLYALFWTLHDFVERVVRA